MNLESKVIEDLQWAWSVAVPAIVRPMACPAPTHTSSLGSPGDQVWPRVVPPDSGGSPGATRGGRPGRGPGVWHGPGRDWAPGSRGTGHMQRSGTRAHHEGAIHQPSYQPTSPLLPFNSTQRLLASSEWRRWEGAERRRWDPEKRRAWAEDLWVTQLRRRKERQRRTERMAAESERARHEREREARRFERFGHTSRHHGGHRCGRVAGSGSCLDSCACNAHARRQQHDPPVRLPPFAAGRMPTGSKVATISLACMRRWTSTAKRWMSWTSDAPSSGPPSNGTQTGIGTRATRSVCVWNQRGYGGYGALFADRNAEWVTTGRQRPH